MLICSLKGTFVFVCLLALCHRVGPFVMSRAPLACPAGVHLVFVHPPKTSVNSTTQPVVVAEVWQMCG